MRKSIKFLRIFVSLLTVFFTGSVLAAGYSCPTQQVYDSCVAGRYLSKKGEAGNACLLCSAANNTTSTQSCSATEDLGNGCKRIKSGSQTCSGQYTNGPGGAVTVESCTGCSKWGSCTYTSYSCTAPSGWHVVGSGSTCNCERDCSTSKACSSLNSTYLGTYNECDNPTGANACYKSCTVACSQPTLPTGVKSVTWGSDTQSGYAYINSGTCSATVGGAAITARACPYTVTECQPGYYKNGNACTICPAGQYCTGGTAAPQNCPAGTYRSSTGGKSQSECSVCEANKYSNPGATSCTACATGYGNSGSTAAAHAGETSCKISCAGGTYVATAKAQCTTVGGGYWKEAHTVSQGSTSTRNQCPAGYRNGAATSAENLCVKNVGDGQYVANQKDENASQCVAGTAKAAHTVTYGGTSTCSDCTGNTWSGPGAKSCTSCNTGYSITGTGHANHDNANDCKISCAGGTYVATAGAQCTVLGANKWIAAHTVAQGSVSSPNSCTTGYTTRGATADFHDEEIDCKIDCAAGSRVVTARATCTTPAGNWWIIAHTVNQGATSSPTNCATGYSISGTATTDHDQKSDCKITCAAGTQVASANQQCTTPSGNWYTAQHVVAEGSVSSPTSCLANYTISGTAATNHDEESDCKINCAGGTYLAKNRDTTCTAVVDGYYAVAQNNIAQGTNTSASNTQCPAGDAGLLADYGADYAFDIHSNGQRGSIQDCYNQCQAPWTVEGGTMTYAQGVISTGMPRPINPFEVNYAANYDTSGQMHYMHDTYGVCTYDVNCDRYTYDTYNAPGPNPICVRKVCTAGYYCPLDEGTMQKCPVDPQPGNGQVNSIEGDNDSIDKCFSVHQLIGTVGGKAWTTPFENGAAKEKCYWNDQPQNDSSVTGGQKYSASCTLLTDTIECNGGFYYPESSTAYGCASVGDDYFSANRDTTRTKCPVRPTIGGYAYTGNSDNYPGSTEDPKSSISSCYLTCDRPVAHSTSVTAAADRTYYNGSAYPQCTYDVVCDTGYTVKNNNTGTVTCDANVYTITLDKNGGNGSLPAQVSCTFDSGNCFLPATTPLARTGYANQNQWCTAADGTGTCYDAGTSIAQNISLTGTAITLYAKWTPKVYTVRLNHQHAQTEGSPEDVFLKYDTAWYTDEAATSRIRKLTQLPLRNGYVFEGYYSKPKPTTANGKVIVPTPDNDAIRLINERGEFEMTVEALEFTTTLGTNLIYAWWTPAKTTCAPGTYYKDMVGCVTCETAHYCRGGDFDTEGGDQGHERCDALGDWMYTDTTGNTDASACYQLCTAHEIEYGTAHPYNPRENWPTQCSFYGISETGNECEIIDGRCVEKFCKSDYELIDGYCTPCNRENAVTYVSGSNCQIATCVAGYHPNISGRICEEDTIECSVPNATIAHKVWDVANKSFSDCIVDECDSGYHLSGGVCVVDEESCTVEHGIGRREWDEVAHAWGPCMATACDAGYTNDPSESDDPTAQCGRCRNYYSILGQVAASSYVQGCELASCLYSGELYILQDNECVPICDIEGREDDTGTMKWNPVTKKCDRVCKPGYSMW